MSACPSAADDETSHTNHNQSKKAHRNGIKKPAKKAAYSMRGVRATICARAESVLTYISLFRLTLRWAFVQCAMLRRMLMRVTVPSQPAFLARRHRAFLACVRVDSTLTLCSDHCAGSTKSRGSSVVEIVLHWTSRAHRFQLPTQLWTPHVLAVWPRRPLFVMHPPCLLPRMNSHMAFGRPLIGVKHTSRSCSHRSCWHLMLYLKQDLDRRKCSLSCFWQRELRS